MAYYTKVTLGTTDVTEYLISYGVEASVETDFDRAEITLAADVSDALTEFKVGDAVTIQRGVSSATEYYIFRGIIAEVDKQSPSIFIKCYDKLWSLTRKEYTASYDKDIDASAGNVSKIAFDLAVTQGELNGTWGTTFQDSGAGIILDKFICNHDKIYIRLDRLRDLLNWQLYYNPQDDKVYFEPLGTTMYDAGSLRIGQDGNNVVNVPKWIYNFEQCINKITIHGAEKLVETTEYFSGTGSQSTFQLGFVPRSVKVYVSDVLKVGGISSSTTDSYDYSVDDDPEIYSVIFESTSIPTTGTDNIKIDYTYAIPVPVQADDPYSIQRYETFDSTKILQDIKTVSDAEDYAKGQISKYALPFINTKLKITGVFGLMAGMRVRIVDTINNEDRTLVVKKISYNYPEETDTINVGDENWRVYNWMNKLNERLARIERESSRNTGQLVQIKNFSREFFYDNRYLEILSNTIGDGDFIAGHVTYGKCGGSGTGFPCGQNNGTSRVEDTIVRIVHPDDMYVEDFYDTDFKDSTNTTADWSTSTKELIFTA